MSKSLSGLKVLTDGAGTVIQNGNIITNSETITGDLTLGGKIVNGSCTIQFDNAASFVDFNNLYVNGSLLAYDPTYGYNINVVTSIDTINNLIGTMSYYQPSDFNIFHNLYCSGQIQYLDNDTGDHVDLVPIVVSTSSNLSSLTSTVSTIQSKQNTDETNITNLQNKTTAISYAAGSPNITNISDKLQGSVISFSNTLNGVSTTTFGYISTLSGNCQNQLTTNANSITSAQNDIQVLKDCTRNLTATSSASTFANTLNTSTLNASTFVFSNTINNISVLDFSNVMMYCKSLTSDCQNQISAAAGVAASGLALATTASAGVAGIVTTTLPAMSALITANTNGIAANTDAIGTLQQKTTGLSYSNATTISTIGLLNATTLRIGNLESGFTQITNSPIVIIGTCEHRNGLSVTNGFGLSVDGGIVQNNNSANTFNGSVSCIRDFTTSGTNSNLNSTNIQIGTSSAAALTVNATSTFASDATFAATKKLVIKNIVPRNLDDIYFGGEAGAYVLYNTIFNTKTAFNEPVSVLANYKQGSTALRFTSESFNSTYSVTANTSVTLSAPLVSIGNLLSATTIYGNLVVVGSITNSTGILGMIGQVVQQF